MQASFTELLRQQQDPSSPRYHRWLTPQQVGEQYGPTQHDLDALTSWLGFAPFDRLSEE
jgi:subtilase family serine protease